MSEQTKINISSVTGTFRSLGGQARASTAAAGNIKAASGNSLPSESVPSKPDMAKIAKALNAAPSSIGRNLKFKVDLDRGTSVIQVLDRETGEIIRQIPPEKVSTYLQTEGGLALRLYDEIV
jgi:flagellar protein FlaG